MKYINLFDTQAAYDAAEKYYPNVSYIEATDEVVYQENDPGPDYSKEYLTFEALESGTFTFNLHSLTTTDDVTSISYSIDNGDTWVTTANVDNEGILITTPTINVGDKLLWKGISKTFKNIRYDAYRITSTNKFNVSGNLMSLFYGDNFTNQTTFPQNTEKNCWRLFENCINLISAENLILPAATLTSGCYSSMFYGCTSLTTAPELPATTIADGCYGKTSGNTGNGMFYGCTSLTKAPALPATTLANSCYQNMFSGCTSLTTAPELPATTMVQYCYQGMFGGCTNLNSITMLATDISASNCLGNWVSGVAATGTFTKAASMTTLPTGNSGIPSGWTVVEIN